MKYLKLSNTDQYAIVDDGDWERCRLFKWYLQGRGNIATYFNKNENLALANFVMQNYNVMYDHKDNDAYNNQKYNLRQCTYSQNGANKRKRKVATSKYKGVYWNKRLSKWTAKICYDYKQIHLGCFDSEIKAARAYDRAAKKYFGEFAALNFREE